MLHFNRFTAKLHRKLSLTHCKSNDVSTVVMFSFGSAA
jgi:hypothetical protein